MTIPVEPVRGLSKAKRFPRWARWLTVGAVVVGGMLVFAFWRVLLYPDQAIRTAFDAVPVPVGAVLVHEIKQGGPTCLFADCRVWTRIYEIESIEQACLLLSTELETMDLSHFRDSSESSRSYVGERGCSWGFSFNGVIVSVAVREFDTEGKPWFELIGTYS